MMRRFVKRVLNSPQRRCQSIKQVALEMSGERQRRERCGYTTHFYSLAGISRVKAQDHTKRGGVFFTPLSHRIYKQFSFSLFLTLVLILAHSSSHLINGPEFSFWVLI